MEKENEIWLVMSQNIKADIAQMVERFTCNEDVMGSTPVVSTNYRGPIIDGCPHLFPRLSISIINTKACTNYQSKQCSYGCK